MNEFDTDTRLAPAGDGAYDATVTDRAGAAQLGHPSITVGEGRLVAQSRQLGLVPG